MRQQPAYCGRVALAAGAVSHVRLATLSLVLIPLALSLLAIGYNLVFHFFQTFSANDCTLPSSSAYPSFFVTPCEAPGLRYRIGGKPRPRSTGTRRRAPMS
jgi:hypothetical protein